MDERVLRIEALLDDADERAAELAAALLDLYGEGLARILRELPRERAAELADDELVAHLMLVHDLHPVPVEARVRDALDGVRPFLDSHGGDVELLGVAAGVAHVRMRGSCDGCPSSAMTLKHAIEEAIAKAAPDVERVEAEGVATLAAPALLQIQVPCPAGEAPQDRATSASAPGRVAVPAAGGP